MHSCDDWLADPKPGELDGLGEKSVSGVMRERRVRSRLGYCQISSAFGSMVEGFDEHSDE